MTHNQLVDQIAKRAAYLQAQPIDWLRRRYAESDTATQAKAELAGRSKGEIIEGLLYDQFSVDEDYELTH